MKADCILHCTLLCFACGAVQYDACAHNNASVRLSSLSSLQKEDKALRKAAGDKGVKACHLRFCKSGSLGTT